MSDANKTRSGNTWPSSGGSTTGNIGTGAGQRPGSGTQGMSDTAQQAKEKLAGTAKEAEGAVKETAQEAMSTTRETVTELAEQTQQQASEVISQVSEQVTGTIGEVKEQATTSFTQQRDRAVSSLSALSEALREAGRTLESNQRQGISGQGRQDQPAANLAPFIDEAADRLAQSADFLRNQDIGGLLDEAQRLARKQPGLFVASMFGIGLVGARLLKGAMSDDGTTGGYSGSSNQFGYGSGSGSGYGSGSAYGSQSNNSADRGPSGSTPSGLGGSSIGSGRSGSRDATQGQSANALTGEGPFDSAGPGTTTYAPSDPTRTGYEHANPSDLRPSSGSRSTGSADRSPESSAPGAGWVVDHARRPGDTVDPAGSVNTDPRLHEHPGGGAGTTDTPASTTRGSAQSGYGAFDADTFADRDRADAVTGGDRSRFVGREEGERRS